MDFYNTILLIANELDLFDVPYEIGECWDGWQLTFPWCDGDIACHSGTYGSEVGDVESFMFPWDEGDVTRLHPIKAANQIIAEYVATAVQEGI